LMGIKIGISLLMICYRDHFQYNIQLSFWFRPDVDGFKRQEKN
jgi:hypothetical protein